MPELRRREDGSLEEVPPAMLDCGHPYQPRRVIVGYSPSPDQPDGPRMRTYQCRECWQTTWVPRGYVKSARRRGYSG